jgi:predicted RNA polymerase sigma factor
LTASDAHRAIDAIWRIEAPRLIAGLARMVGDLGLAEDLAQDALVAALERWPTSGIPRRPGAWLMAVGKRRAVDLLRRRELLERKLGELASLIQVERGAALARNQAERALLLERAAACARRVPCGAEW